MLFLVREDNNGLYTVTNGGIYRPTMSNKSYYHTLTPDGKSGLRAGGKYVGHRISQSPHIMIGSEVWHLHGSVTERAYHPLD